MKEESENARGDDLGGKMLRLCSESEERKVKERQIIAQNGIVLFLYRPWVSSFGYEGARR